MSSSFFLSKENQKMDYLSLCLTLFHTNTHILSLSLSLSFSHIFSFASLPISRLAIRPLSLVAIRVNKARKMLPGQITKECKGKKKTFLPNWEDMASKPTFCIVR